MILPKPCQGKSYFIFALLVKNVWPNNCKAGNMLAQGMPKKSVGVNI